jgi:hypothetical protein
VSDVREGTTQRVLSDPRERFPFWPVLSLATGTGLLAVVGAYAVVAQFVEWLT